MTTKESSEGQSSDLHETSELKEERKEQRFQNILGRALADLRKRRERQPRKERKDELIEKAYEVLKRWGISEPETVYFHNDMSRPVAGLKKRTPQATFMHEDEEVTLDLSEEIAATSDTHYTTDRMFINLRADDVADPVLYAIGMPRIFNRQGGFVNRLKSQADPKEIDEAFILIEKLNTALEQQGAKVMQQANAIEPTLIPQG